MPAAKTGKSSKAGRANSAKGRKAAAKSKADRAKRAGLPARALPGAPTGKVSAAKLALGDAPVRAYIATLPPQHREIAQAFDDLMGKTFPDIRRGVKWGMPFYGLATGWFVSCGGFVGHVKVNFFNGTKLKPVPPVGKAKFVRSVDLVSMDDFDAKQLTSWVLQASKMPGLGAGKM